MSLHLSYTGKLWRILVISTLLFYVLPFKTIFPAGANPPDDSTPSDSWAVDLGDLDGDGDLDAFVGNQDGYYGDHRPGPDGFNEVWINDGTGYFSNSGQQLGTEATEAVRLADLDNDNDLDAFTANTSGGLIWVNDGNGNFTQGPWLGTANGWAVDIGDLDGDGDPDIFMGVMGGPHQIWLNEGGLVFTLHQGIGAGDEARHVILQDLDGDLDLDAFIVNHFNDSNRVFLNDGNGTFSGGQIIPNQDAVDLALGDVDGDGDIDALVGNSQGETDDLYLNDGSGNFSLSQQLGNLSTEATSFGDFNNDGSLDIYLGDGFGGANRVWFNDGSGNFTDSGQALGYFYTFGTATGDLDNDGDLDIFDANMAAEIVWLNNGAGIFTFSGQYLGQQPPPPQTITVQPDHGWIDGYDWPIGSNVTVTVDNDADTENGFIIQDTQTAVPADWNPSHGWVTYNIELDHPGVDLLPGHYIEMTDGSTTVSMWIDEVYFDSVDEVNDTAAGRGPADRSASVWIRTDIDSRGLDITVGNDGNWSADFGAAGFNIENVQDANIQVFDDNGNSTMAHLDLPPRPSIEALPFADRLSVINWPAGIPVNISIDDPGTGQTPDHTEVFTPYGTSNYFEIFIEYDIKTGDIITATNGEVTKVLEIPLLEATNVDRYTGQVQGVATPNTNFQLQVAGDQIHPTINDTIFVDSNGNWTLDYGDVTDLPWVWTTIGRMNHWDEDGDGTLHFWHMHWPILEVWLDKKELGAFDWEVGSVLTFTVDDPATPEPVDFSQQAVAEPLTWMDDGYAIISVADIFELEPGMTVTVTDETTTKSTVIQPIQITTIDTFNDVIAGTAPPNADLDIVLETDYDATHRFFQAGPDGSWVVDYSVPDADGQPAMNLQQGDLTYGLFMRDADTDATVVNTVDWVAPPSIPLVYAISNPADLNVPSASVSAILVLNTLNETLFQIDNDTTLQPVAATGYTVTENNTVYTITLRPGALWSDGAPVTAQHYVDGILRVLDPSVGSDYGFVFFPILNAKDFNDGIITDPTQVGVKALDTQTLEITLEEQTSHFSQVLASPALLPARQDVIDLYGENWTSPANYVGNGPYRLVEYDEAHVVVEENPQYNGPIITSFPQIAFDVVTDPDDQIRAYKNGEVDVLLNTPIDVIMGDPVLQKDLTVMPSPGFYYIGFSSQVAPTDDPLVRKALASAIDRQKLIDEAFMTPWRVKATGVIPPELPGYQGSLVGYSYDSGQAQGYLSEAGYPGGFGFPAINIAAYPGANYYIEEVAAQWETVLGITVNIDYFPHWERTDVLVQCRANPVTCGYNAFPWGWAVDYPDAYNILNDLFHPDSDYNYTQWDNAGYRNMLNLAVSELNINQRLSYLQQAQQILVEEDAVILPLVHYDYAVVIRPGIYPYYSNTFFSNLAYWSNVDPPGDGMNAAVIGSAGGSLSTDNNTISVDVPAGSLQDDVSMSVTDLGGNYQITASQEELNVLTSYSIQPHGLEFDQPVTLTFAWNDSDDDGFVDGTNQTQLEANIYLRKDGQAITPVCSINPDCDMDANTLTIQVTSLSLFELVVPVDQPPSDVVITAPQEPVNISDYVPVTVKFIDPDDNNSHSVAIDWGDSTATNITTTGTSASALHQYQSTGVYTITATVTDAKGHSAQETYQYVVVYDPNDGFVTGGGWMWSPEGAYTPDTALTGKATFGFVSKYQKGAKVPTGNTQFQFKVADLNFKSTSYDWLVIAGTKAKYKGVGTINEVGEYAFLLTAIDGSPDKFRIKIWELATGNVVYDNQLGVSDDADPTNQIEGGSIVVHQSK